MAKHEGLFTVDKPIGMTSQRVVQVVKQWAWRKTGKKNIKVGHAGTLDPFASGVLVIGVGRKYTQKLNTIVANEKEYIAKLYLGEVSTTDDIEGEKRKINKEKRPKREEIINTVKSFVGEITQLPPVYSAIKINGQEAYKRVRRGEKVTMRERKVLIKDIHLLSYDYPYVQLRIVCGKGTYIRALARDIGAQLSTGAYLVSLKRTRIGDFCLKEALPLSFFGEHIAVHAAELDGNRIDGTRVYINQLLRHFGTYAPQDQFTLYHYGVFNEKIAPLPQKNYRIVKLSHTPLWTQTRFALALTKEKPDVLWMPFHNAPFIRSKKTKIVVTIHDLAFKVFPKTFTRRDLYKLNSLTSHAVKNAHHIIAVSEATKKDILRFYPFVSARDITVVHHGVDYHFWQRESDRDECEKVLLRYKIKSQQYIIHVGTIQPRKNLTFLIDVFERIKEKQPQMKLILVGSDGWLWQETKEHAAKNQYASDIVFTGNIPFNDVRILMQNARIFVFPSLYEGFGLPGLEACAAGVPVVAAHNSSIPEILGDSALYFENDDIATCVAKITSLIDDRSLRQIMCEKGKKHAQKFSWEKCAKRTLSVLHR